MSFDLQKILESKRAQRRQLAARPMAEKLRMLDALRERALTFGGAPAPGHVDTDALREEAAPRNIICCIGKDPLTELEPIARHFTGDCAKDCSARKGKMMSQFSAAKMDFKAVFAKVKASTARSWSKAQTQALRPDMLRKPRRWQQFPPQRRSRYQLMFFAQLRCWKA